VEKLQTAKAFSKMIEDLANDHSMELLDTIVWYCEKNEIEVESAAKLLTTTLKEKLYYDASKLRIVKRNPELPL
jgi:hypothetical protein